MIEWQRQWTVSLLAAAILCGALAGCARDRAVIQSSIQWAQTPTAANTVKARPRIAILDFRGIGGGAFSDLLAIEFLKVNYEVVERTRIDDLVQEQSLSLEGYKNLTDTEKAARLGRILNADVILTGVLLDSWGYFGAMQRRSSLRITGQSSASATCRAIDARTGEVLWVGTAKCDAFLVNGEHANLLTNLRGAAREIVTDFGDRNAKGGTRKYKGASIRF